MKFFGSSRRSRVKSKRGQRNSGMQNGRRTRQIAFEPLEDRRMLSVTAGMLADINATAGASSNPQNFTDVNGTTFFVADDGVHGKELWKTDRTGAGTQLVKDIFLGSPESGIQELTAMNGTLFFRADDGVNGAELWRSDGTTAGTVMVKDLFPGWEDYYGVAVAPGTVGASPSRGVPNSLTSFNGMLFFAAQDATHGMELWKSDGTDAGTVLVKDIRPVAGGFGGELTIVNDTLFFRGTDGISGQELWKTDGTNAGTVMIKDIAVGSASSSPQRMTNVNGTLFFAANDGTQGVNDIQLWKSDGTAAGTVLVKNTRPAQLTDVNGTLFFSTGAANSANGQELWKSDGTTGGTVLVKDINDGSGSSDPGQLTNINGTVYFSANDGVHGRELWKSDGTANGTVLVKDIFAGSSSGLPLELTAIDGTLFFSAEDGGIVDRGLWKSDGMDAGTVRVDDMALFATVHDLTNVNGTLFFRGVDGSGVGAEPWFLFEPPVEVIVDPDTINDDLQSAVADIQSTPPGSGAAPAEVVLEVNDTALGAVVAAVEALAPAVGGPVVTIVITLADGDYSGQNIDVPAGVRLVIDGTSSTVTFVGASPAFTVSSGEVLIKGVTFSNATDAPTILVTGGSLILRDSLVQETTGGSRAAIEITGGSVDLGSALNPGGNTIEVRGAGELIRNSGVEFVTALGNVFQVDGADLETTPEIESLVHHGLDSPGLGIVGFVEAGITLSGGVLVVSGLNTASDTVNITKVENSIKVIASFNSDLPLLFPAAAITEIRVITRGGNDVVTVGNTVSIPMVIEGGDDDDSLTGGNSNTLLYGGNGNDTLTGGNGNNHLIGGGGNDTLKGANNSDVLEGGDGDDTLLGGNGDDTLDGGAGDDILVGGNGDDLLLAGSGDDIVDGGNGSDTMLGDAGDDTLTGGNGEDVMVAGDGNDTVDGGNGSDLMIGGAGADSLLAGNGDDILIAGYTTFDDDLAALEAIMAEWGSNHSYAQRVANLTGMGVNSGAQFRLNGSIYFVADNGDNDPTTTVFDDEDSDTLTGNNGTDLFFARLQGTAHDWIVDLRNNEIAEGLSV